MEKIEIELCEGIGMWFRVIQGDRHSVELNFDEAMALLAHLLLRDSEINRRRYESWMKTDDEWKKYDESIKKLFHGRDVEVDSGK